MTTGRRRIQLHSMQQAAKGYLVLHALLGERISLVKDTTYTPQTLFRPISTDQRRAVSMKRDWLVIEIDCLAPNALHFR